MEFQFKVIYLSAILIVSSLRTISSQRPSQGYGIPETPLDPPPPPVARPSSPTNDADYVLEEFPPEVPVKSKPIESPDRDAVKVGDESEESSSSPSSKSVDTRNSYNNNVRPPVPAIPSVSAIPSIPAIPSAVSGIQLDPPLGGYDDPRDAVMDHNNRNPAKVPNVQNVHPSVGSQYPSLKPSNDETFVGAHHFGASGCTCVPYFQCDEEGYIITTGAGIIDPRIHVNPNLANFGSSYSNDDKVRPNFCGTYHTCCMERKPRQEGKKVAPTCGTRNPSGISPRILTPGSAKSESEFGEWPWMAAVLKLENDIHVFQCGGTLIDNQHVLTVAHCVSRFSSFYSDTSPYSLIVRLGEWDTQQESELIPHEDYRVIKVVIHPEFMNQSLWNDLAILRLDRVVEMRQNINPVCLPSLADQFEGQICTTTGWGKNAYQGGTYSNIMKEAHLPLIPRKECLKSLRSTRLGPRFRLHSSFICAGGEKGVDSCKGDGGGPLVCERKDGSYAVTGLVAWGIDCGQPGIPGVYVNVQSFLQFIKDHTTRYSEPYNEPEEGWGRTPAPSKQPLFQDQNQPESDQKPQMESGYQQKPIMPVYQERPEYQKPIIPQYQRPIVPQYQRPIVPQYQKPTDVSRPENLSPPRSYGETPQVRPPQSFPVIASGY